MDSIKSQGILPLQCGYEDKVQTLKKTACPTEWKGQKTKTKNSPEIYWKPNPESKRPNVQPEGHFS